MKHLLFLALLLTASALHAQRAVQKNPNTGALTEGFATGANTLTISAAGTLTWTSGATLSGAADFRSAAGLAIGTDVQAYVGTSSGGNGTDDAGKLAAFDSNGSLLGSFIGTFDGGSSSSYITITSRLGIGTESNDGTFVPPTSGGSFLEWQLPGASGTIITTGNLSSITATGTVTSGTWSGSFGAVSGANLTTLNASNLASGTVPAARLGSGTADSTTYLRGDNTWQTISSGLTIGTTAITGGTSGRVLYNNGGVVGELRKPE